MKIKYKFVNESTEIEVSDEWNEILLDLDREEYNTNRRETRRHISLNSMDYEGDIFADDVDVEKEFIRSLDSEQLHKAMRAVSPKQRELINAIYYENISITEYSKRENVDKSAICHRLETIHKKLKKYL